MIKKLLMVQVTFVALYLVLTEHRRMIHYPFCVNAVPRHHNYPKVTYNHLHLQNHPVQNVLQSGNSSTSLAINRESCTSIQPLEPGTRIEPW